jgi:uncharacterized phage protein (TIGR01671 family)
MRTTRYRVWDKINKKMFPVVSIFFGEDGEAMTVSVKVPEKFDRPLVQGDNCELLQSTGLVDYLGNEIFEGDLIRVKDGNRIVYWGEDTGCWEAEIPIYTGSRALFGYLQEPYDVKIIGNIFEGEMQPPQ